MRSAAQLRSLVQRLAQPVKGSPEKLRTDGNGENLSGWNHLRCRRYPLTAAERRKQRHILDKPDHFGLELKIFPRVLQDTEFTHLQTRHHRADNGADDLLNSAANIHRSGRLHRFLQKGADIFECHLSAPRLLTNLRRKSMLERLKLRFQRSVDHTEIAFQNAAAGSKPRIRHDIKIGSRSHSCQRF